MGNQNFTILKKPTTLEAGDEIIFNTNRRRLYFSRQGARIVIGDDKDGLLIGNIDRPEEFYLFCRIIAFSHQLDVDFDWNANNSNYWKISVKKHRQQEG